MGLREEASKRAASGLKVLVWHMDLDVLKEVVGL